MKLKYAVLVLVSLALSAEAQTSRKRTARPATRRAVRPAPVQRQTPPPVDATSQEIDAASDIVPDFSEPRQLESLNTLGDLGFLPPEKAFVAGIGYTTVMGKNSITQNNLDFSKTNITDNRFIFDFAYGIYGGLSGAVRGNYASSIKSNTTYGIGSGGFNGLTSNTNSSGLAEPTFELAYRLLNQDSSYLNLDLKLKYSPAMENHKSASAQSDGNNVRGGDEMGGVISLSKKFNRLFEILGDVKFSQQGKNITESTSGLKSTYNGYLTTTFDLGARLHVGAGFFLNGQIGFSSYASESGSLGSGTTYSRAGYSNTSYQAGVDYVVKKDLLILQFAYITVPDYSTTQTSAAVTTNVSSSASGYGVNGQIQF